MKADFKADGYAIVIKESGEGCDYTIGCGERAVPLKAMTLDDVEEELKEILPEWDVPDRGVEYVLIVKIEQIMTETDLEEFIPNEEGEDDDKAARRRQYEKLKKEFG